MIEGELDVADLPDACNEGRRELLGVTPPDHATGRLQDVHSHVVTIRGDSYRLREKGRSGLLQKVAAAPTPSPA